MLAIEISFAAGRYHATPWGRHVNEAEVAWPPEPWRLMRAMIATWHHKLVGTQGDNEHLLHSLVAKLSGSLPEYHLPPASHGHTRHYLPQWKVNDTSLVFDAFASVDPATPLLVIWPDVELDLAETTLLDDLLHVLGYLGRAESWVEARRVESPAPANCVPGDRAVHPETGEVLGEVVTLHAPLPEQEYAVRRQRFLAENASARRLADTLPQTLVAALRVDSAALQKQGWSDPPASRLVSYLRPVDALRPQRIRRPIEEKAVTTAVFVLTGKPLPRVEDTLRIGELVRVALISRAGRRLGADNVPAVFSGHGLPIGSGHQHAFFLPVDSDGDGRLDRVVIYVPAGFRGEERRVIEDLRNIFQGGDGEWGLLLEGIGDARVAGAMQGPASKWATVTPYLHPWHQKKGFGVVEQLYRECRLRGIAEPVAAEPLLRVPVGHRLRRPIHFRRFRRRRGLTQPDRQGGFWRLTFAEPVMGPLAFGFGCHFGLGLFLPVLQ